MTEPAGADVPQAARGLHVRDSTRWLGSGGAPLVVLERGVARARAAHA